MDGVKQQIRARQMEAMDNKHIYETRKLKRELRSELDKISSENKSTVTQIKKDFQRENIAEKNALEMKLTSIRKKNNNVIKGEESRFKKMIEELKVVHGQKMTEMKISQEKLSEKQEDDHQSYLETARTKFEEEQAKLEA
jgi:hypothetical protein